MSVMRTVSSCPLARIRSASLPSMRSLFRLFDAVTPSMSALLMSLINDASVLPVATILCSTPFTVSTISSPRVTSGLYLLSITAGAPSPAG